MIAAATSLALASGALAQTKPPSRQPTVPVSTQTLMQNNGGSLLQASMPQQPSDNGKAPSFSLYAVPEPEPRVLKKHDLVNIIVREESTATATGTTDLKKSADFDAKVDQWVKLNLAALSLHGTGQAQNPVEIKTEGTRDFKGDASVDRSDSVTLRLEAEVIDVKPNGTLVIQARKHIKWDEEEQTAILTGVCRVQDVDITNSVLSTDLHDLDLQKITTGAVRDTTKRGWIPRLLDFINPF
jgi:flagellar L-ring protein precursor FlgH